MRGAVRRWLRFGTVLSVVGAISGLLTSCASNGLSNSDLLAIARGAPPGGGQFHGVIGTYEGAPVYMDVSCGKTCPEFLGDMIYLDVPTGDCARHGGTIVRHFSSKGIWMGLKLYCEPTVLVDAAPIRDP